MRFLHAAWLVGFCLGVCVLAGCDSVRWGEVTGTVKFDGQDVDEGSIGFLPVDGKGPTAGGKIVGGKYTERVPVGAMKVVIGYPKAVGKKKLYDTPDSPYRPIYDESIPAKYSDINKTELTFEVKPGTNKKDWDLSSK